MITLTISPTDEIVEVMPTQGEPMPMRIWRGTTERGTEVVVMVTMLSPQTDDAYRLAEFDELIEVVGPSNYT